MSRPAGLTGDHHRADDLVQDTLLRAWEAADRFEPGTNLLAWLYTILRNRFLSEYRSRRHQLDDPDGKLVERLSVLPSQDNRLDYLDLRRALAQLAPEHREALLLVGAEGLPFEEAAAITGVPLGTFKSRINRARSKLAVLLSYETSDDLGPDRVIKAVVRSAAFDVFQNLCMARQSE